MHFALFGLIAFAATVSAGPPAAIAVAAPAVIAAPVAVAHDFHAYPQYKSSYSVSDAITGDHKSAHEERDGEITRGSYSFLQPDGVVRTVKYISTPLGGFQAQVINSGAAVHPAPVKVAKVFAAPVIAHAPAVVSAPVAVAAPAVAAVPVVGAPVAGIAHVIGHHGVAGLRVLSGRYGLGHGHGYGHH